MPTPQAPKSAFSAKPSSLGSPVPGKGAEITADSLLAEFDAPVISAPIEHTAESLLAESPMPMPTEDFTVQEPNSTLGVNTDIRQQFADLPVRVAANIAGDPNSVKLTLEKKLGKDNVRMKGDTFYFKQPGEKAFRKLDPTTFEIVNDLFSDFYKEGIQAIGGTMGAVAGAPAGPLAAAGGTALGVAAATGAVDAYGQSQLGVVKDQSKFSNQDPGLGGQLSRGAQQAGENLKVGAEYAAFEGIFKGLASKWASRRAKTQGLRTLKEISPTDRLQESVRTNLDTLNEMRGLGLTSKIEGTNIEIPAHQLLPHLPEVNKIAQSVSAEKAFFNAQKEAAENFGEATINLVEEASGITSGKMREAIRTGVPSAKEVSAAEVTGLFNSVRKSEGILIGQFRDKARDTAKKSPLPAPKTSESLKEIFNNLGVTMKEGQLKFPNDDSLAQMLGTDSKAFIGGLKSDLTKINDRLTKGGLTIDELIGQSKILGAKNDGARRIGGSYKSIIGKLSSALRSDSREGMTLVLDPVDAAEYTAKMNRFSSISKSMDQLDSYLRDDIGMNTFAKGLVNKGKEGLSNLRSAKEFLLQENPVMYKNLIGEYMEELALKHRKPGEVAGFNPAAMKKELIGLGGEYLDELFPKNGEINKGLVLRSFDLADQVQRSIIKGSDEELIRDSKKALGSLSVWHRSVNATYALLNFGSKNNRLLKLLSREGVESFLAEVPKKNREKTREVLSGILSIARKNGTLAAINSYQPTPQRLPPPEPQE